MLRQSAFSPDLANNQSKPRFYFQLAGFKRLPLPWLREFMAAYQQGLAAQPAPIIARNFLLQQAPLFIARVSSVRRKVYSSTLSSSC